MNDKYTKIERDCETLWNDTASGFGGDRFLAEYIQKARQRDVMKELSLTKLNYIILTVIAGDKIESWRECK